MEKQDVACWSGRSTEEYVYHLPKGMQILSLPEPMKASNDFLSYEATYEHKGDTLVVWRLDRLGRSLRHLIDLSEKLQARGIALRSLTEAIDTSTVAGRFLFALLGALASMEREVLIERTRAGLAAAAARGRKGGRPPVLDADKLRAAKAMLASGTMSATDVARQLGCAPSTLYRHLPGGVGGLNAA